MKLAAYLAAIALFAAGPLAAQHVGVIAGARTGRGLTYVRGTQCFVITPKHVVDDVDEVEIIGAGSSRAAARLLMGLPEDIAVLRVTSGDTELCRPWPQHGDIDAVLGSARGGMLQSRSEYGGWEQLPVHVTGFDFQGVNVRPATGEIQQGMSGSAVVVGSTTVAMLLTSDMGSGTGRAIRLDRIEAAVMPLLGRIANPGPPRTYPDSVCAAVTRLLASARVNFADIIDRPLGPDYSSDGRFLPKVAFPRMRSTVTPRLRYYGSFAYTRTRGEAEAAARQLSYAVSQCISGWSSTESDSRSDSRTGSHYFNYRDPASRIEIMVRYQSRYESRSPNMWIWGFTMVAPEPRR